jgi:hypothetical protein
MLNLFNPWVWIGFMLAVLSAATAGYYKGERDENTRQQLEIAELNAEARQKEQALVAAVNTQAVQLVKANNEAKILNQKRSADLATGVMRLRVPVSCPVQASGDAPTASGANLGTAELQPATAQALVAITDDADATARKLNTCINLYNEVREALRSFK